MAWRVRSIFDTAFVASAFCQER